VLGAILTGRTLSALASHGATAAVACLVAHAASTAKAKADPTFAVWFAYIGGVARSTSAGRAVLGATTALAGRTAITSRATVRYATQLLSVSRFVVYGMARNRIVTAARDRITSAARNLITTARNIEGDEDDGARE
jgi:hypothetical protein